MAKVTKIEETVKYVSDSKLIELNSVNGKWRLSVGKPPGIIYTTWFNDSDLKDLLGVLGEALEDLVKN